MGSENVSTYKNWHWQNQCILTFCYKGILSWPFWFDVWWIAYVTVWLTDCLTTSPHSGGTPYSGFSWRNLHRSFRGGANAPPTYRQDYKQHEPTVENVHAKSFTFGKHTSVSVKITNSIYKHSNHLNIIFLCLWLWQQFICNWMENWGIRSRAKNDFFYQKDYIHTENLTFITVGNVHSQNLSTLTIISVCESEIIIHLWPFD